MAIEGSVSAYILLVAYNALQVIKKAHVRVSECKQVWHSMTELGINPDHVPKRRVGGAD